MSGSTAATATAFGGTTATGRSASSARCTGKTKRGDEAAYLLTATLWADFGLGRTPEYELFELIPAIFALIFINGHGQYSL